MASFQGVNLTWKFTSLMKIIFFKECQKWKKCTTIMILRYHVKLIKKYYLSKFQRIWTTFAGGRRWKLPKNGQKEPLIKFNLRSFFLKEYRLCKYCSIIMILHHVCTSTRSSFLKSLKSRGQYFSDLVDKKCQKCPKIELKLLLKIHI